MYFFSAQTMTQFIPLSKNLPNQKNLLSTHISLKQNQWQQNRHVCFNRIDFLLCFLSLNCKNTDPKNKHQPARTIDTCMHIQKIFASSSSSSRWRWEKYNSRDLNTHFIVALTSCTYVLLKHFLKLFFVICFIVIERLAPNTTIFVCGRCVTTTIFFVSLHFVSFHSNIDSSQTNRSYKSIVDTQLNFLPETKKWSVEKSRRKLYKKLKIEKDKNKRFSF